MDQEQQAAELAALEAEIAKVNGETAEIEQRREPSPLEKKKAELEAAKRKRADAEVIEKLEAKFGKLGERIVSMSTPLGMIVVKAPSRQAYKEFADSIKPNIGAPHDQQQIFVSQCVVWPAEQASKAQILNDLPGAVMVLANKLMELGGAVTAQIQGK